MSPDGPAPPSCAEVRSHLRERLDRGDAEGAVLPELTAVLRVIARHQLVMATGHLSREAIRAVVVAAADLGIADIVSTHPEFPSQSLPVADQLALTAHGALLERCCTPTLTGRVSVDRVARATRATGVERTFSSSTMAVVSTLRLARGSTTSSTQPEGHLA